MIALISGKIVYKGIAHVIVDVQGVGYRVFIPLTTFYELPEAGQTITLHVHTNVKQDAINLFGFHTIQERDLFQLMISVSGIGPRRFREGLSTRRRLLLPMLAAGWWDCIDLSPPTDTRCPPARSHQKLPTAIIQLPFGWHPGNRPQQRPGRQDQLGPGLALISRQQTHTRHRAGSDTSDKLPRNLSGRCQSLRHNF